MKKNRINLSGTEISYLYNQLEKEATILMIHGNSLSAVSFKSQLDSKIFTNYNMIAIDLPGHGESQHVVNFEDVYCLSGYCSIIASFIEEFGLKKVILVGHSLGGHIALETKSEAIIGRMIFGAPPLGIPPNMAVAFLPNPNLGYAFQGKLIEEEAIILAKEFVSEDYLEVAVSSIMKTDPNARLKIGESIGQLNFKNEIEIVESSSIPIAILHGSKDKLINRDYIKGLKVVNLWKSKVIDIDAGHSPQLEADELFNSLLLEFSNQLIS